METDYKIIRADGSPIEVLSVDLPAEPGYEALVRIVRPVIGEKRDMERVMVVYLGAPTDMFVDEMGAFAGLPRNERATAIYRANALKHHPLAHPEQFPAIYGDAVLFLRRVWF